MEPLGVEENMSTAKSEEINKGNGTNINFTSIEGDTRKLEPEVVRMLVGLVVATGVIGALVFLT